MSRIKNELKRVLPEPAKKAARRIGLLSNSPTGKRVAIVGWIGAFNLGDEMMLDVTLEKMKQRGHEVTLITHKKDIYTDERYGSIEVVPRRPLSEEALKMVVDKNSTLFVNGGALIDDRDYDHQDSLAKDIVRLSNAFIQKGKKVIFYGVSVSNSLKNSKAIADFKFIYDHAEHFSVRDGYSAEELKKLFRLESEIEVVDDIELSDPIISQKQKIVRHRGRRIISLIPILLDETIDGVRELIQDINRATGLPVRIVTFYDENSNDIHYIDRLAKDLGHNRFMIDEYLSPRNSADLYNALCDTDTVISMRYHGTLFAGAIGKKVIGVDYDKHPHYQYKNEYIRNEYGYGRSYVKFSEVGGIDTEDLAEIIDTAGVAHTDTKKINKRANDSINRVIGSI